jgi:hypothetical protein
MADLSPNDLSQRIRELARQVRGGRIEFPSEHPAAEDIYHIVAILDEPSDEEALRLPRRDRYAWVVFRFEKQVMNGGVDQYLSNSSGNLVAECLEALQDIGANKSWALLDRACMAGFGGLPSRDQGDRQKQLQDFRAKHGCHLDDWLDREKHQSLEVDLYQKLLDYWKNADATAS